MDPEFEAWITEQIPDERIVWTTIAGEVKQDGVVTFHHFADNKSKVMLQLDYGHCAAGGVLGMSDLFIPRCPGCSWRSAVIPDSVTPYRRD
ncbi:MULTISPECIES: hypothetical protein [unclassified Streptomyces]|uniref:hypothetical protein n=1 Tax=unclassified Streptomyces TaxID=2593676 RepID=UPI0029A80C62|nr:hypothetical protein [Streptomyces sp. DK15]MDX2389522.1 hypothetical protein [Streptomyces sp. DK15]